MTAHWIGCPHCGKTIRGESRMCLRCHSLRRREPIGDRLMRNVEMLHSGCWQWMGATADNGYGLISVPLPEPGTRRTTGVHRASYEHHVGPIPEGFEIDHLCRNRACVNPAHLEAVTPEENNRRSSSPTALNARKTACNNGHAFTVANTYAVNGKRGCRECRRENDRLRRRAAGVPVRRFVKLEDA